jgi:hypothetical protein
MSNAERFPVKAGPVPDKLTIWPVDDGRYGLDATFQGASGYQRADHHQQELQRRGVPHTFRQELGGGWTLRFGPFRAIDVASRPVGIRVLTRDAPPGAASGAGVRQMGLWGTPSGAPHARSPLGTEADNREQQGEQATEDDRRHT